MQTIKKLLALKKYIYLIGLISWLVFITSLSLFSFSDGPSIGIDIPHLDKAVHFTFYFVATILGVLVAQSNSKRLNKRAIIFVVCMAIIYGAIIEVLQMYMALGREADFFDFWANTAGATLAGLLTQKYRSLISTLI